VILQEKMHKINFFSILFNSIETQMTIINVLGWNGFMYIKKKNFIV
jgi:hypothetical protein